MPLECLVTVYMPWEAYDMPHECLVTVYMPWEAYDMPHECLVTVYICLGRHSKYAFVFKIQVILSVKIQTSSSARDEV
jgi:hypothetical protein